MIEKALIALLVAAVASSVLTLAVRRLAVLVGWLLDEPDARRKQHEVPTPRAGGLALYAAILVTFGVLALVPLPVGGSPARAIWVIVALGGLMLLVGLYDDIRGLSPRAKLAAQTAIALVAWAAGFRILAGWSYDGAGVTLGVLSIPVTVLWIVGVTNAFNLIDGLDGLAAGIALFATIALAITSLLTGPTDALVLLAVLAGATAGFLRYNFNPASIFLGDSGSLFLGSALALLSIHASHKSTAALAIAVPIVALGLPMLDTTLVVIRRLVSRQSILKADRRHIHHVLLERGLSPKSAVVLLYGVAGLLGLVSLLFLNPLGRTAGLALLILGAALVLAVQQLRIPEFRALSVYASRHLRHQRDLLTGGVEMKAAMDRFSSVASSRELFETLQAAIQHSTFSRVDLHWRPRAEEADAPESDGSGDGGVTWQWVRRQAADAGRQWQLVFPLEEGTLTLFHEHSGAYPVSAVCWLGQDMTREFERALRRVQAGAAPGRLPVGWRREAPAIAAARAANWPAAETHA
jgi:UDP-GlcNAc:undecaprenyl-phosphate GlcNAc-1-phosphate transferase